MSRYQVVLETTASAYITVEAEDEEAAIEAAFDHLPGICAQCSGWGQAGMSLDLGEWELPRTDDGSDTDYGVRLADDEVAR